jgi:hypothetical protein
LTSDLVLEEQIKRVIACYNRIHTPNATIRLIAFAPPLLVVQFTGDFYLGCNTLDITDAFADQVKILSKCKTQLEHDMTAQINPHTIQTTYIIKTI